MIIKVMKMKMVFGKRGKAMKVNLKMIKSIKIISKINKIVAMIKVMQVLTAHKATKTSQTEWKNSLKVILPIVKPCEVEHLMKIKMKIIYNKILVIG